jgi:predicted nucleic acid-binding Zn ribbon protein
MADFDEHDEDDPNDPDESDQDYSDDPEFVHCPYCRKLISEDAEMCPHCGSYVSQEDAPPASKPRWFLIGVVVTLIVVAVVWVVKGW